MKSNWNYPTTIWAGENRFNEILNACSLLEFKNPLFVTDKDLVGLDITKKAIDVLSKEFKDLKIFSDFSGNPTGKNVEDGKNLYKKFNNDGVIAFGGGSAIDVGKAVAFMSCQSRPIWDFEDIGDYWKRANSKNIPNIIAVPTTAGTGSETGRASAIVNEKTFEKKIIFHPKFLPSIVILDPTLTLSLSPRLTASTGMDALAHNLEAYCAPGFHPMADGIALEGMNLIKKFLIKAVKNGKDIEARMNLLTAASMGSTAFQKGLGAIHSLSHPVNAKFNIHHGLSNGIFMPYVLTFNKNEIENRVISICNFLGLNKTFDSFIAWVLEIRNDLQIPHKLSDVIDTKKIDLDELSQMALDDPSTATNPKKLTLRDFRILYQNSISGELF